MRLSSIIFNYLSYFGLLILLGFVRFSVLDVLKCVLLSQDQLFTRKKK